MSKAKQTTAPDVNPEELMSMDLVIGKKDGTIDNASIPVRWCLSKPLLDKVTESDYISPQVLIQVDYINTTAAGNEYVALEERHIFDLDQFIAYVPLSRAGKVSVSAFLVGITEGETRCYRQLLNRYGSTEYRIDKHTIAIADIRWVDSKVLDRCVRISTIASAIEYKINVPTEVFGKKPPAWLLNLITRYGDKSVVDQCALRRKFMMFPLTLIAIIPEAVARFASILLAYVIFNVVGFRKLPARFLLHPLTYWGLSYLDSDMTFCTKGLFKSDKSLPKMWLSGLAAIYRIYILMAGISVGWLALAGSMELVLTPAQIALIIAFAPLATYIALTLVAILAIAICGGAIAAYKLTSHIRLVYWVGFVIAAPFVCMVDAFQAVFAWLETREIAKRKAMLAKRGRYLTCNNNPHSITADVSEIPLADQSIALMYNNVKNKFCKPLMR